MTRYMRDSQMFEKPIVILGKTVATLPSDAPNGAIAYVTDDSACRIYVRHSGVWTRAASSGPFMIGPWAQDNVPTDASDLPIGLAGDPSRFSRLMMDDGDVIGINVWSSDPCEGGSLTAKVTRDGVPSSFQVTLGDGEQMVTNRQAHELTVFSAGERLGVAISTSSDWAPTSADITVELLVSTAAY